MSTPTPETLAETERLIYAHKFPVEKVATTILDLIAAVRAEKAAREEAEQKYQRERSMKGQWRKKARDLDAAVSEKRALIPKITETVEDSRTPAPEGYSAGHWYQVARKWERYAREWERYAREWERRYSACPDCGSAGYAAARRALTEREQDQ